MLSLNYQFYPRLDIPEDYYQTQLFAYLGALHRNGQIIGDWNICETSVGLELFCIIPAEDALEPANCSQDVQLTSRHLRDVSARTPQHVVLGKIIHMEKSTTVATPSGYVLYANLLDVEPPVLCADDGLRVPLYRLPYYQDEKEHAALQKWESVYKACDEMDIQSGVGEEFGHGQMTDLNSQLNQEGRDICRNLESKTERPWYYYLQTYPNAVENCPGCGAAWTVDIPYAMRFDLKCDQCRLVSSSPADI